MTVCTTDRPDAPPQPTTYLFDVQCVRCGTWTAAGENVMARGGETECWNYCPATTLEDE